MTLEECYKKYPTQEDFVRHLEKIFWGNEPVCPYCQTTYCSSMPKELRYHCNNCNASFSVTTATLFHKTRIDFQKWLYLIFMILNNESLPVRELGEILHVTKDTAAFMIKRINFQLSNNREQLYKIIEHEK